MEESYEKKLYNIFKSFDNDENDELDHKEVNALCKTLQLDLSQRKQLWSFLDQNCNVSFEQFRDALIDLTNNGSKYETYSREVSPVSEREISPKHVFGKRKHNQSVSPNSETSTSGVSSALCCHREDNLLNSMMLNISYIIELWENCGIPEPVTLLQELGINTSLDSVNIPDLITTVSNQQLNKVQKNVVDSSLTKYNHLNKPFVFLKALNSLNEYQVQWLKMIIKEMNCEMDKLKYDLDTANNRAVMIAQEVDENYMWIEQSSENKIAALEHNHDEKQKTLIDQWRSEKDQLLLQNALLYDKVEKYENKLQSELLNYKKQLCWFESENTEFNEQLDEIKQKNVSLEIQVKEISKLKLKELETEYDNEQIIDLVKKIDCLKNENKYLRDQNDELVMELESTKLKRNVGTDRLFESNVRHLLEEKNIPNCFGKAKEFSTEESGSACTNTSGTYIIDSDFETRN